MADVDVHIVLDNQRFEASGDAQTILTMYQTFIGVVRQNTPIKPSEPETSPLVVTKGETVADRIVSVKEKPKKERREFTHITGVYHILDATEKMVALRQKIAKEVDGNRGPIYNNAISKAYTENDMEDILSEDKNIMSTQLYPVMDQIRAWYNSLSEGEKADLNTLSPYALASAWKRRKYVPNKPKPQPELRKSDRTIPDGQTLAFVEGKLQTAPVEDVLKPVNGKLVDIEEEENETPIIPDYDKLDFNSLNDYDYRILKKFTEEIADSPYAPEAMNPQLLSKIIANIRGVEKGTTPKCAISLSRLRVLFGTSGNYKLTRDYLHRFDATRRYFEAS